MISEMATAASSITFLGKNIYNRNEGVKETPCIYFFSERNIFPRSAQQNICVSWTNQWAKWIEIVILGVALDFLENELSKIIILLPRKRGKLSVKQAISNGHRKPKKCLIKYRNMMDQFAKVLYLFIYLFIYPSFFCLVTINCFLCL